MKIEGSRTVGSGFVIGVTPQADGSEEVLVATAWHVPRDVIEDMSDEDVSIPVSIFKNDEGESVSYQAELICHSADIDFALLRFIKADDSPLHVAPIGSRQYLDSKRVLEEVVAVGCPLGVDPVLTKGELLDLHHDDWGEELWMVSTPSYIGNSGGMIADWDDGIALSVFSKIYNHGGGATIIPHMGLGVPLSAAYDFIEESGVAKIVESGDLAKIVILDDDKEAAYPNSD